MGTRGPIPKPEQTLARPRSRRGSDEQETLVGERLPVTWQLEADPEWHEIAINIYNSFATSGQSAYFQDSDWAVLYSVCEDISYYKKPSKAVSVDKRTGELHEYEKPRSGQMLASIMGALNSLLPTEGERRRIRMELQAKPEEKADLKVVAMEKYKKNIAE